MNNSEVVDVDDPSTWPAAVSELVDQWIKTRLYTSNLAMVEAEADFCTLFHGFHFRAYHCTRLLPHEVEMIRTDGLRMLTASLVRDRIERALNAGAISSQEAEVFHGAHVFARGEEENRTNRVCLVFGKSALKYDRDGLADLLGTWGGEAIYRSSGGVDLRKRLKQLGSPMVVTAAIDITDPNSIVFPNLPISFVKATLRQRSWSEVHYRRDIPSTCIESIRPPGQFGNKRPSVRRAN